MFTRAREDASAAIQDAWAEFERAVGLGGRKFFGAYDHRTGEYRVCAQLREDDDPGALGFHVGELPGGGYLRVRLQGKPPGVYERIAPIFEELAGHAEVDESRPTIEFYKSLDVIDLLLPVI